MHVALGVTSGLGFVHRNGRVHGSLNPAVVQVTSTGLVKVGECSMSLALEPTWEAPDDRPDLERWRAPEQFSGGRSASAPTSTSAALLLYFMATGRPPYDGPTAGEVRRRHQTAVPTAPSKLNPAVPRAFEAIIGRSLAKRPETASPR